MERSGPNTRLYRIATLAYLAAVIAGAWRLGFFDPEGTPISPSDWGDVLAGVFSPLAFLWLYYASLSQRAELELQREELRLNNKTQDEQRAEMQKQVEAMTAQSKLLEAQANAAYEPVFVVDSVLGIPGTDNFLVIDVSNNGANVLNVKPEGDATATDIHDGRGRSFHATVHGNVIPYWRAGHVVRFTVGNDPHGGTSTLILSFQRLDATGRRNVYEFVDSARRIELRTMQSTGTLEVDDTTFL